MKTYTTKQLNGLLVKYVQGLQARYGERAGIVVLDIAPFLEFIESKEEKPLCDVCNDLEVVPDVLDSGNVLDCPKCVPSRDFDDSEMPTIW